jgi:hypothetical protein
MKRSNTGFIMLAFVAGLIGGMFANYVGPASAEGPGVGIVVHVPVTGDMAKKRVIEANEFRLIDQVSGQTLARLTVNDAGDPTLVMLGGRDKKTVSTQLSPSGLQVFCQAKEN